MRLHSSKKAIYNVLAAKLATRSDTIRRAKVGEYVSFIATDETTTKVPAALFEGQSGEEVELTILPGSLVDNAPETTDNISFRVQDRLFRVESRNQQTRMYDVRPDGVYGAGFQVNSLSLEAEPKYGKPDSSEELPSQDFLRKSPEAVFGLIKDAVGKARSGVIRNSIGATTSYTVVAPTDLRVSAAVVGGNPKEKVPVTLSAGSYFDDQPRTLDNVECKIDGQWYNFCEQKNWLSDSEHAMKLTLKTVEDRKWKQANELHKTS